MSLLTPNVEAALTLVAGLWASLIGWCHPAVRNPAASQRDDAAIDAPPAVGPERAIGPLIVVLAVLEFIVNT